MYIIILLWFTKLQEANLASVNYIKTTYVIDVECQSGQGVANIFQLLSNHRLIYGLWGCAGYQEVR